MIKNEYNKKKSYTLHFNLLLYVAVFTRLRAVYYDLLIFLPSRLPVNTLVIWNLYEYDHRNNRSVPESAIKINDKFKRGWISRNDYINTVRKIGCLIRFHVASCGALKKKKAILLISIWTYPDTLRARGRTVFVADVEDLKCLRMKNRVIYTGSITMKHWSKKKYEK